MQDIQKKNKKNKICLSINRMRGEGCNCKEINGGKICYLRFIVKQNI